MGKLLSILSMFGPLAAGKFWVAVIMAVVMFVQVYFGINLGLDEQTVTAVVGGIGAILVWLVPNANPNRRRELTEAEARAETGWEGEIENRTSRR